jgi:hypothetical protein
MYYIVERTDQGGGYLTPPGSEHSYTDNVLYAQMFTSKTNAKAQCCENERVVTLESLLLPSS